MSPPLRALWFASIVLAGCARHRQHRRRHCLAIGQREEHGGVVAQAVGHCGRRLLPEAAVGQPEVSPPPRPGENTTEVLAEAGYSPADISALVSSGAVAGS